MYTQYETKEHYVVVDHDILHHPFRKAEKVYRVRVGDDTYNTTIKANIEPYILANYGEIISKKTYK